jgi:hypothetical protein
MSRNSLLLLLGAAAVGVFALGWFLTSGTQSSTPTGPQNAVNPNAQDAPAGPFGAQGTMPDIGNLLSYNQVPGATILTPQATSVDPFSSNYGVVGG